MRTSRILVADDSRAVRICVERILTKSGFEVILACNGVEAVELTRKHAPELVILDIIMPEMDGYSACEKILSDRTIPILFLTKDPGQHLSILGDQLGAYLPKPVEERELVSVVHSLIHETAMPVNSEASHV